MNEGTYRREAAACRAQAIAYVGQAEGSLLLKVAAAFDDLADMHEDGKKLWPEGGTRP